LARWIDKRETIGLNGHQKLFCTLSGKTMSTAYVRSLFKRLGRKEGIAKRVHPHGLRRTHAFELANEGHPLHVVQAQLGHSSLATTDRYVKHLAPQMVIDAMRGRAWQNGRPASGDG
jgi:site-specific recombinase XerD